MRSAHAHAIRSETAVYAPEFAPVPDDALARLERAGPRAVEDHELLGLVGVRVDASILAAAGGLRGLLDDPAAPPRTFLLAREDRARVHALLDLHLRWMGAHLRRDGPLESPEQTRRYLTARLRPHPFEVFACLLLDNRHRIIAFEALFRGTVDGASVHPRVVARRALAHNAAALIACHNHPNVAPPERASRLFPNAGARACVRQRGVAGAKRFGGARAAPRCSAPRYSFSSSVRVHGSRRSLVRRTIHARFSLTAR